MLPGRSMSAGARSLLVYIMGPAAVGEGQLAERPPPRTAPGFGPAGGPAAPVSTTLPRSSSRVTCWRG